MNRKKLIILISVIIILAALVCAGLFVISQNRASRIEDKLDMGEKYLEDLKYEKAIAAYKEVLKIDPKNTDAYLGMAEVYIAMGEYEEALEILEEGYEETGDGALKRKIKKMTTSKEAEGTEPETTKAPQPTEDVKKAVEVTVTYGYEDIYVEELEGVYEHESAIVEGLAEDGTVVWKYEATPYPILDFKMIQDVGSHNNVYYFQDKGNLIAFEITTGKILWQTKWGSISYVHYTFDEEGTMYLCGGSGPDLLVVDARGNVLERVDSLHEDYYWPFQIEVKGDYVFITYEGYSNLGYDGGYKVLSYCLTDGTMGYGYNAIEPEPGYSGAYFGASYQDELYIEYQQDGTYLFDLTWLQLLAIEDGQGFLMDGIFYFSAEDSFSIGEVHQGKLERVDDMLLMTITNSTLDYAIGSKMYFTMSESGGNLFDMLPKNFSLSSEEYMYENTFRLNADSTIEGYYYDRAEDYSGASFPNGTIYLCEYDGDFSDVKKLDDFIYTIKLNSLKLANPPYESFYEGGYQYYYTEPYGLQTEAEYIVFLPGASFSDYQGINIEWEKIGGMTDRMPENYYFIYNTTACVGFIGTTD